MRKEELRKLRTLRATKRIIDKADHNIDLQGNIKYFTLMRCQELNGYLKIAIFLPKMVRTGNLYPSYEIFFSRDGSYITRIRDEKTGTEQKWLGAMLENIQIPDRYCNGYWGCTKSWMSSEGNESIKRFLHVDRGGWEGIRDAQTRYREEKIEEARRKEVAPWDTDMELVHKYPERFQRWCEKEVIAANYIFYKYDRKVTHGYCSYCEKEVPITGKIKHNQEGLCSCCKKKILYKSIDKFGKFSTYSYSATLIQPIKDGIVVRIFSANKSYTKGNIVPKYTLWEHHRVIVQKGLYGPYENIREYSFEEYKDRNIRWCRVHYDWSRMTAVYPYNLSDLKRKQCKQSGLVDMIRHYKCNFNVTRYIRHEKSNPALEPLIKIKLFSLANSLEMAAEEWNHSEIELLDTRQKELAKILRIDNARFKRLRAMKEPRKTHLIWFQKEKRENTIYEDEMIEDFGNEHITPANIEFINDRMSYKKIYHYLKRQQALNKESLMQNIRTWEDYLDMAEHLKMRVEIEQIYKPANLKAEHDKCVEIENQASMEKIAAEKRNQWPDVDKICETLGKYEYQDENYAIVKPNGILDIVREGTILNHCVHTSSYYYDRIQRRESYLLFLRKTKEISSPWYTLEVEPNGTVRQKRTTGDNQNEDLQQATVFLRKWQKHLQKVLKEEDKKLGEMAKTLRKENYAKLRKEQKKVWHGKLAGKLLADVLEADLLELEEEIDGAVNKELSAV